MFNRLPVPALQHLAFCTAHKSGDVVVLLRVARSRLALAFSPDYFTNPFTVEREMLMASSGRRWPVYQLTGKDKFNHDLIGKLTAIIGYCELMETNLQPDCKQLFEKIKTLALDSVDMVLSGESRRTRVEEQQELFL